MPGNSENDDVGIRGKVELSVNWWKTAWPMTGKPKNDGKMLAAIKAYKKAKMGKSEGDLRDALNDVDGALVLLQAEAKRIPKKNPLKRKAIKGDLEKARAIVKNELSALDKYGNTERVVYKRDFAMAVSDAIKDTKIRLGTRPVQLKLMEVLALEMDAKNALPMLNNMLNDAFDAKVKDCDKDVRVIIKGAHGLMDADSMGAVIKNLDKHATALEKDLRDVPLAVFRKIRIHADVARRYKKEKAVTIAKGTAGVGLGIAGAALPGTLPFALVALARSVAALAKEIVTIVMALERKIKIFLSYLDTLAAFYKKHRGAREMTMSALNNLIGVEVLPTLNKAKGDLKEIEKSVAVFYHRAQKLFKKVNEALDKSNELTKRYEKSASDLQAFMKGKKNRKVRKAMKNLDGLLNQTHDVVRQATEADKQMPYLRKKLKDLGENSSKVDKANVIIGQAINLAWAVGGLADAGAAKALESVAVASVGLWKDSAEAGWELGKVV